MMSPDALISRCLFLVLWMVASLGCGERSNNIPVQGHVSYNGSPLTKGAITFFPQTGRPITESISETGDFSAELLPGEYDVVFNVSAERPAAFKEGDLVPPPKIDLPAQYTTRAKTTLKATIAPGQEEPINFDLK